MTVISDRARQVMPPAD